MKHVFIVTYGRSGGTALMKVLNDIDGVCIRGENGGLIRPLSNAARTARQTRRRFSGKTHGPDNRWHGAGAIQDTRFARSLAASFVQTVLRPPEGTRIVGFKEIRFTDDDVTDDQFRAIMDFMLGAFDEPRIVFVTRDPAQAAESGWWRDRDREVVIDILELTAERFIETHKRHPERTFVVDHAAFDHEPEGLRPLLDWLGEDVSAEQLARSLEQRLDHLE